MTPARQKEAEEATAAFHAAVTALGIQAVEQILSTWDSVPPTASPSTGASWVRRVVRLVSRRRRYTRDLAMSYYRLVRALHTDFTIVDPQRQTETETSLDELRDDFAEMLSVPRSSGEVPETPEQAPEARRESPSPPSNEPDEALEDVEDEDDRILAEEIARLDALMEENERLAEEEAELALAALGPAYQSKLVTQIGDDRPANEVDAMRKAAHDTAGARAAAAAERLVQNGARSTLWTAGEEDQRMIGWARISTTGTPCGWCAMLISRGAVYKTQRSATLKGAAKYNDHDTYHDNCHCIAVPVFDNAQLASSQFDLNRQYAEEWPRITRGLSGKAAVSAWRKHIRTQAARTTPSAQEA